MKVIMAPAILGLEFSSGRPWAACVTGSGLRVQGPEEAGRLPQPAGEGLKITPQACII